jgi:ATP-dependent DNA helicase RecG
VKENVIDQGYAVSFEWIVDDIMAATATERIGTLREKTFPFPRTAVRELVANCLIHQDMTTTGAGPTIELFKDRIEITNPGRSLVDPQRFIDMPPRSRNETLAFLMRRMNICEERGSGIDRVIKTVEATHLPAPDFATTAEFTRAILLGPKSFGQMTVGERVRACYQHTCLLHAEGRRATNSTLRARFHLPESGAAQVSRVFGDARDEGLIKLADPKALKGGYVPNYA